MDDVLSALDVSTERNIIDKLIGPKGLFKELGTTVVLITHAGKRFLAPRIITCTNNLSIAQHLPLADHIIILDEEGSIAEQGTWDDLRAGTGHTSKVAAEKKDEKDESRPRDRAEAGDKVQKAPDPPDTSSQDITRKTGDVTLYSKLPLCPK